MPRKKTRKATRSPMVMHKGEKTRDLQVRMKWLLDFLNKDLDSLGGYELLQLFLGFLEFLAGVSPPESYIKRSLGPKSNLTEEREILNTNQNQLRRILERILMLQKEAREKSYANSRSRDSIKFPPISHKELDYAVHYTLWVTKDRLGKSRTLMKIGEEGICVDTGRLTDALADVISLFPLSRIKTCQKPDCGKYFYQKTTKSKGDFCSRKCQNWASNNRWRKKNRDKYNSYHRTYQSERRDKAKQDRVEVKCPSCGHRRSKGSLSDYLKGHSFEEDCPQCEKAKLLHIVTRWDKSERSWIPEEYTFIDWKNYLRGIQKGEE